MTILPIVSLPTAPKLRQSRCFFHWLIVLAVGLMSASAPNRTDRASQTMPMPTARVVISVPHVAPVEVMPVRPVAAAKPSLWQRLASRAVVKNLKKALGLNDDRSFHWANITALACGVLGFLYITFILAIVFGAIGMSASGEGKAYKGRGMGIAGLVLGILWLVAVLGLVAVALAGGI